MEEKKKTYLEERVYGLLGLTPEQCAVPLYNGNEPLRIKVKRAKDKDGKVHETPVKDKEGRLVPDEFPIFQMGKCGGDENCIDMYPFDLDGRVYTYFVDEQRKHTEGQEQTIWHISRHHPDWLKDHPGTPKYHFPGGETKKGHYPLFPPTLFEKYQRKEHIETIVLTEGYMKAMCASVRGMDVVGLGSITLFADSKTKQLYPEIVKLLNVCKPDNIVILYDGDCRDISKDSIKDIHDNRIVDLAKRPLMFRSALLKLRELLLEFKNADDHPCEIYFSYVNKMREEEPPKGLDDLLVDEEFKDQTEKIADDLNHPGRPGVYFKKINLRTGLKTINATFNLLSPNKFYEEWEDTIDPVEEGVSPDKRKRHQFKFEGSIYQYNADEKKLVQMLDSNLEDYVAVGGEIVLVTEEPVANANGTEWKLFPIPDKVINARYGDGSAKKIYKLQYYTDFTIKPEHENYQKEVINPSGYRFYNMYSPLPYEAEQGDWPHIEKLLRQITKVYGEEYYQMLLDWITLTYMQPLRPLPIIMLVSKERGTGKTSFLNLLKYMYGRNAVIGGNDLIVSKFNSMLAGKLIAGVDESCLGDNKEVGESLKYMSTSKTMHVEPKGKDKKEMPAFIKFVLCSNEVKKGIFISNDEIRYWVMRLTPWADDKYDTEFDDYIEGEVPAFLYYLKERYYKGEMYVPQKEHRMWFDPKRLVNDDLKKMMSGTQSNFEGSLRDFLENMFIDLGRKALEFDIDYIKTNIKDAKSKDEQYIRNLLDEMNGVVKCQNGKYSMPFRVTREMKEKDSSITADEGEVMWPQKKKQCRPYRFDAKYFVDGPTYANLTKESYNASKTASKEASGNGSSSDGSLPGDTQQSLDLPGDTPVSGSSAQGDPVDSNIKDRPF